MNIVLIQITHLCMLPPGGEAVLQDCFITLYLSLATTSICTQCILDFLHAPYIHIHSSIGIVYCICAALNRGLLYFVRAQASSQSCSVAVILVISQLHQIAGPLSWGPSSCKPGLWLNGQIYPQSTTAWEKKSRDRGRQMENEWKRFKRRP